MSDEITVSLNNDYITTSIDDSIIGAGFGDVVFGLERDYDNLINIPIINQDLNKSDFTSVANTYYRHIGNTDVTFTKGEIYYYDGETYRNIAGADFVDYYTKTQVDEKITQESLARAELDAELANEIDLLENRLTIVNNQLADNYYTKTEVDNLIARYITTTLNTEV